jgi:hypothetical protein
MRDWERGEVWSCCCEPREVLTGAFVERVVAGTPRKVAAWRRGPIAVPHNVQIPDLLIDARSPLSKNVAATLHL